MVIILLLNMLLVGVVNAEESLGTVRVFSQGRCPDYLKYNGVTVGCVRVSYNNDDIYYPTYCLDRDLPGIGENAGEKSEYNVEVQDNLINTLIWRVISNSYPYVSITEMGASNIFEAYVATKQAVYCILYGNDTDNFSRYEGIGESGKRTLNVLKNLVNNARNSNETRPSTVMDIIENSSKWEVDNIDKNYISKIYIVNAEADFSTYDVSINSSKLPEDTRIVDIDNKDKTTFNKGEMFKILIPINHKIDEGEFTINVSAKLKTCPVYYGKAPDGMQNYALTTDPYEDGSGKLKQIFSKNNSKIVIIKKDAKTNEVLEGTEFNILDSNKKIVYSNLITDSNGKVTLNGLTPGTYYLQEVRATDGYIKLENLVKFNMELDKEITLTVNNNKIEKSEIDINTEDISVNVEHKENNVNVSTGEQNMNENKDKIDVEISDKDENINIQDTDINIDINDKEENTNIQDTDVNININQDKINTNIQDVETNININEQETNKNVQNTETNVNVNKDTNSNDKNSVVNTVTNNINVNNNDTVKKLPKTGF